MATHKVRPDRGPADGQQVQRQRAGRSNWLNALALVAVIGVVAVTGAMALMAANGTTDQSTGAEPAIQPTPDSQPGSIIPTPYGYDPTADYWGLPPLDAGPSGAERSELVAEAYPLHVGWVYVFEDGRVISSYDLPEGSWTKPPGITEQRLTPQGVELVRSGVIRARDFVCFEGLPYWSGMTGCEGQLHEIPPSAWEDSTLRPYVPYRYAICGAKPLGMLPVAAQELLRGKEAMFYDAETRQGTECFDVTTEEARTLDAILADAGFSIRANERWVTNSSDPALVTEVGFESILPHGTFGSDVGG